MDYTLETKDNKAILRVTVSSEEVSGGMRETAVHASEHLTIPGFRPGKAPYDVVKKHVGDMKLLEQSLEGLIRDAFIKAMIKENLETVGQPLFNVEKMAPENELIFTAEIALHPKVTKIADYKKAVIEKKDTTPKKKEIDQAKKDLARMQTKEVRAEKGHAIAKGDKAVVALGMKKEGVPVEGGESQNHAIYTAEEHYIPGFVEEVLGLKEDESKTFTLTFPKEHYQKHLSGAEIEFTVDVKEIFKLEAPALDDEFAKSVGLTTAKELDEKLNENLKIENEAEEARRQEKEVLEHLAKKSTFETIPDLLVNQEIDKMTHELEHQVKSQGLEFDQYLAQMNKSLTDLKLDFTPTALTRIKVGILLKAISEAEKIEVDSKELDEELDKVAEYYKDNEEARKQVFEPQYRDYVEQQLRNKKTIEFLKENMVK